MPRLPHIIFWAMVVLFLGSSVVPFVGSAHAPLSAPSGEYILFDSRTDFNTAAPGLPVEDWEDAEISGAFEFCTPPLNSNSNDNCFAPGAILPGIEFQDTPLGGPGDSVGAANPVIWNMPSKFVYTNYTAETTTLFFTPTVYAVGIDIASNSTTYIATVTVYGADGSVLVTDDTTQGTLGNAAFWGIVSSQPIARVNIDLPFGGELIDNVAFGGEGIPITPTPSATLTPSATPSATPTTTPSPTHTVTASATSTNTPMPTATATVTPSRTPVPPNINVNPTALNETHPFPEVTTLLLSVSNSGEEFLVYTVTEAAAPAHSQGNACDTPSDLPWLSVTPTDVTIPGGDSDAHMVTFSSIGLDPGTYDGFLCFISNDPDQGVLPVPVRLVANSPTAITLEHITATPATSPFAVWVVGGTVALLGYQWHRRYRSR